MEPLKYLAGYPPHMLASVNALIEQGRLGTMLADKYGQLHAVRSNGQLHDYVQALKRKLGSECTFSSEKWGQARNGVGLPIR